MGFDIRLKRYFPLIVCLFVVAAATFQVVGIAELIAGVALVSNGLSRSDTKTAAKPDGRLSKAIRDPEREGDAILARNAFDSLTGPLGGEKVAVTLPPSRRDNSDPYRDPICDAARVLLIAASTDRAWSFAAIAGVDAKPVLRRSGDDVSGFTVSYVGWNRVWMTKDGARCQMEIGGKLQSVAAPPAKNDGVPDAIASKIHSLSDNAITIERSAITAVLENPQAFIQSLRVSPEKDGDKSVGVRLSGIKPDSLPAKLGLANGDRLESVNGFELTDPQKALELYARLGTLDHFTLAIRRAGKEQTLDFDISH